jgi:hypothetical protein
MELPHIITLLLACLLLSVGTGTWLYRHEND